MNYIQPPNLIDLIYYKKNFLSKEECQIIIDEYENSPNEPTLECCPHAVTGVNTWSTFFMKNPDRNGQAFELIHSTIEKMVCDYQDYLDTFNSFHVMRRISLRYPHMYRIMKYATGAKIHPHTDHDFNIYGSCTINLNDDYEGGMFAFWNGKHKIKMGLGDVMIWPADYFWVHEVEEIKSGTRYSVNCFIRNTPETLNEEDRYNVWMPDSVQKYAYRGENRSQ